MPTDARLLSFLEAAQSAAIPNDTLVGLLTAQGWTEKEIYHALADCYQVRTGIEIPRRQAAGTSAKEAFFYLLLFATLATWTIALANLALSLIDLWLGDPLFTSYSQSAGSSEIASELAAVIVAFPIYLIISRVISSESAVHPETLQSPIRKWLTYFALVVAVCIFMGDLITTLAFFLRGEITSRFVMKALVVLVLSGGVFSYYFTGLRRSTSASRSDRLMAAVTTLAVLLTVALGVFNLGGPTHQRGYRADLQRINRLKAVENDIRNYYNGNQHRLPATLAPLLSPEQAKDPITNTPFEYLPQPDSSRYQICASFAQPTLPSKEIQPPGEEQWSHPAGRRCFTADAALPPPYPYNTLHY